MANFTPEQMKLAKAAKSAEELLSAAKEQGIHLTEQEAQTYYSQLHNSGELADDELENVTGGGCLGNPTRPCPRCDASMKQNGDLWQCPFCGHREW